LEYIADGTRPIQAFASSLKKNSTATKIDRCSATVPLYRTKENGSGINLGEVLKK
jgi:hypothetical protein